jgi:hypothetical protein
MTNFVARAAPRSVVLGLAAALASACSSSSSHKPAGPTVCASATAETCTGAPAIPAGASFIVSGTATYDFVPATYDPLLGTGTLDFANAEARPVRGADVEIRQCGTVLATATTNDAGGYSATFTPGPTGPVYAVVLAHTASPPIQVQDNVNCDAVWAVAQPIAASTVDVHAPHGWTPGAGYGPNRIAAPFAILDSMYTASHRLMDIPRTVPFASVPLAVNWSPSNSPTTIGTSYYDPSLRSIFVLGAAGLDTDEFDREVIVHEWSHYFEDNFSRSDSPGGAHGFGDVLDPRLAFGEGYASAFAAILLDQRIYADTLWSGGALDAFGWDVETAPSPTDDPTPNALSELSVIRALWDFYDDVPPNGIGVLEPWDSAVIPLAAIYDTLIGPERTTKAFTTLASFVWGLKQTLGNDPAANAKIDAVLTHYNIRSITSEFGDGDPTFRGTNGIYTDVPDFTAGTVTLSKVLDGSRAWNERPQNQYYVFTTTTGTHATVVATSNYDVDLYAYDFSVSPSPLAVDDRPYALSKTANVAFNTTPGHTYVVWLNGWGGISSNQPGVGTYGADVAFSN